MSMDIQQTALMLYLNSRSRRFHEKILELRECVEDWLTYIPQSFAHYTRHTAKHSDAIVSQISKLMFRHDDPSEAVLQLSPSECFVVIAAAYLHDAGMVVSDKEKSEILSSTEWKSWVTNNKPGGKRLREIDAFRSGLEPADPILRDFLADIQIRFLVAEFVRRNHHYRVRDLIYQHQAELGRFAFDDPILKRTISDVCIGHGLKPYELEDRENYPEEREIQGESVNVRFLALLLRIGDLLDVSSDRACPLLMNAACPLPPESFAHWTQYQRFSHRFTGPDRIELTADCLNQDEHRYLADWCGWLVAEVRNAGFIMAHSSRHRTWHPPLIDLDGPAPTIVIRPARTVTYIPSKWRFELDNDVVFGRLINDVYDSPDAFIRELIQNALDANRCQMYMDLADEGLEPPEYPTHVAAERRRRYPVRITLKAVRKENELSGETEEAQELAIEDCGIGMDREVIQKYLLQVGRSFYSTEEFRRRFRFVPTSRFGVGFLSVFAASDLIKIETYKPSSTSRYGPIDLTLTGVRNYLLTDRGNRTSSGTRVALLLRSPLAPGQLPELVKHWCRRVEFPILVEEFGNTETVEAEVSTLFTQEIPDVTEEGAAFVIRAFPINRPGIEGEIYVLAHLGPKGERWDRANWAHFNYPQKHPLASAIRLPEEIRCFNGIVVGGGAGGSGFTSRIDYRGPSYTLVLSRESFPNRRAGTRRLSPEIESRLKEVLRNHLDTSALARSENGWSYKQRLVGQFDIPEFWSSEPETIRMFQDGHVRLASLDGVREMPSITVVISAGRLTSFRYTDESTEDPAVAAQAASHPLILAMDLARISRNHLAAIFERRRVSRVYWQGMDHLAIDWVVGEAKDAPFKSSGGRLFEFAELPDDSVIGFGAHKTADSVYESVILNITHPIVLWLRTIDAACAEGRNGLRRDQFEHLISLLETPLRFHGHETAMLADYINAWKKLPGLSADLYPPEVELKREMFGLRPRTATTEHLPFSS